MRVDKNSPAAMREREGTRPALDPVNASYAGYASADDNIARWMRTAIADLLGADGRNVRASVQRGVVTLEGSVQNNPLHSSLLEITARTMGVADIVDRLTVSEDVPGPPEALPPADCERTLVYVKKYCGLEDASTTAAIRQGITVLDKFMSANGTSVPAELTVVYRNLVPGAITLEIGAYASPALALEAAGGISGRALPGGSVKAVPGELGGHAVLLEIERHGLLAHGAPAECWQVFGTHQFRPWNGHSIAPILVATDGTD